MGTFWAPFLSYKFAFGHFRFSCFLKDTFHLHPTFQQPLLRLYHALRRPFLTVLIIFGLFFVVRNSVRFRLANKSIFSSIRVFGISGTIFPSLRCVMLVRTFWRAILFRTSGAPFWFGPPWCVILVRVSGA